MAVLLLGYPAVSYTHRAPAAGKRGVEVTKGATGEKERAARRPPHKKKRAHPAGPGAAQARANGRRAKRPPSRTLLEYLDWRGDLTFSADPPNEVDSLIFCWLAYLDLDCAARPWQQALPLPEAAEWYKTSGAAARFDQRRMSYSAVALLQKAAQCARFQNVRVWGFTRRTDGERAEQFAAVSFGVSPALPTRPFAAPTTPCWAGGKTSI